MGNNKIKSTLSSIGAIIGIVSGIITIIVFVPVCRSWFSTEEKENIKQGKEPFVDTKTQPANIRAAKKEDKSSIVQHNDINKSKETMPKTKPVKEDTIKKTPAPKKNMTEKEYYEKEEEEWRKFLENY
jgi:hypothetical protein